MPGQSERCPSRPRGGRAPVERAFPMQRHDAPALYRGASPVALRDGVARTHGIQRAVSHDGRIRTSYANQREQPVHRARARRSEVRATPCCTPFSAAPRSGARGPEGRYRLERSAHSDRDLGGQDPRWSKSGQRLRFARGEAALRGAARVGRCDAAGVRAGDEPPPATSHCHPACDRRRSQPQLVRPFSAPAPDTQRASGKFTGCSRRRARSGGSACERLGSHGGLREPRALARDSRGRGCMCGRQARDLDGGEARNFARRRAAKRAARG